MDATAMALRQSLDFSTASFAAVASSSSKEFRNSSGLVRLGRRRPKNRVLACGFSDQGHVQYYKSSFGSSAATAVEAADGRRMTVTSGKEIKSGREKSLKKMKKKQLKLLKGLSRDLSTFSQMGFGLDSDGLLDQVKGNMITEATQLLLEQLQKVKAEEKESKRKLKEEKARSKAAARMQNGGNCEMSSSSSSESSDSECGEVVDMSSLKLQMASKNGSQQVIKETTSAHPTPIMPAITSSQTDDFVATPTNASPSLASPAVEPSLLPSSSSNQEIADSIGQTSPSCFVVPACSKKIEVCMGGKCKKSGAGALLEEFQRVVGIEGAVSGCKCMGKCRDAPNVKVVNASGEVVGAAAATATTANSLCIGVGLEDVNVIVANFLGEHHNQQLGFAAAS